MRCSDATLLHAHRRSNWKQCDCRLLSLSGADSCGARVGSASPIRVIRHRAVATLLERPALLHTMQMLNSALFVDARHGRVVGRIQADTLRRRVVGKVRLVVELERPAPMRLEFGLLPESSGYGRKQLQNLRKSGRTPAPQGSMDRCKTRRLPISPFVLGRNELCSA